MPAIQTGRHYAHAATVAAQGVISNTVQVLRLES